MKRLSWICFVVAACSSAPTPAPVAAPAAELAAPIVVANADEPWRAAMPGPAPERAATPLPVESFRLPNGLAVYVIELHDLPITTVYLASKGGAALDPPGLAGLTAMTFGLMRQGSGNAWNEKEEKTSAQIDVGVEAEYGWLRARGLSRFSREMVELVADAALRPVMRAADLRYGREQISSSLVGRRGSAFVAAYEMLPDLIFGTAHPYGHSAYGTPQSLAAITIDQIREHRAEILRPDMTALVIAGDVKREQMRALAVKHFGALEVVTEKRKTISQPAAKPRRNVTILHRVNVSQSLVCAGRPVAGVNTPDELPLAVANEVLGGDELTSRLMKSLREDKGYTYGVQSWIDAAPGASAFIVCSSVQRDATAKSLRQILDELAGMRDRPPDDAEIAGAIARIGFVSVKSMETVEAIAAVTVSTFVADRPRDYYEKLGERLIALRPEVIREAATRYFDPASMQILIIGDAALIKKDVAALNLGEVVVYQR